MEVIMHPLLTKEVGKRLLLLGNEAIVRGALEAGLGFATTYPGTPSSEIGDRLFYIARESDLYFEYSTNEKVALEMAAGAAVSGVRAMSSMKHVGLNVAADALMTLAYVGVRAGMIIITADDPSMFSSQNEQDNRYYAKLSSLPMLEPTSAQEAKEMTKAAFEISEALELPVLLRTTTRLSHCRGIVITGPLQAPKTEGTFEKNSARFVTVPANARVRHKVLLDQAETAREMACQSPFNAVHGTGTWGIATSGIAYNYVLDAVKDLGIEEKVRILKLGFSYPFPEKLAADFIRSAEKILVVEELEPFLEDHLKVIAHTNAFATPIEGKGPNLFSRLYEYNPGLVRGVIARFFGLQYSPAKPIDIKEDPNTVELPLRPPNLCPGCPHRNTYYIIRTLLKDMNVEAIFPTDIGCYTLGLLPPLEMADFLICMGSSVGSAGGIARATKKKVISFVGDSTFFHAAIPGLINAVHNGHEFVLVILDNGTTAMTGHQPHPGVELVPEWWDKPTIRIEPIVEACGVTQVTTIDPTQLAESKEKVMKALNLAGLSVIVSRAPCPLYEARMTGRKKEKAYRVGIKCEACRHCLENFGCPALYLSDVYYEKAHMVINDDLCIGCGFCDQFCDAISQKKLKAKGTGR
jgi:indolepyruvate ferredoxin oxidoreductase alpha subunit